MEKPEVKSFPDSTAYWDYTFSTFKTKVYLPVSDKRDGILNYGYTAPYLLVFEEQEMSADEAKSFAEESGLARIASEYGSSVVFVYPTCEGGWKNASDDLYLELIANSKIHECHKDGYAILNNRLKKVFEGYGIRGAIFRTFLFGYGESADYIAKHLIREIEGEGLWGPADVAPAACILERLSVAPVVGRRDMPVVSIGNSIEINSVIMDEFEDCYIIPEADYPVIFEEFLKHYKRWVGTIQESPDFEELGMTVEGDVVTVKKSEDNNKYPGQDVHDIGYFAFYNKGLFDKGPVPLVMAFHGGGDSAMHIAQVTEWYKVAHDYDFLLVCVEDHLNSTATETVELLEKLFEKYKIDRSRVYASGFSMGGCKSWDLYQEYPQMFAGISPNDATFEVGYNFLGEKVQKDINEDVKVPIFYTGGEVTPLPELPFQAQKCMDRMEYVFKVNDVVKEYSVKFEDRESWENPIWGINGDRVEKKYDASRDATLTLHYFDSVDGNCYSVFGSISEQGHDCRHHTVEEAWKYLSRFARTPEGIIVR